jgi:hypothetical protein
LLKVASGTLPHFVSIRFSFHRYSRRDVSLRASKVLDVSKNRTSAVSVDSPLLHLFLGVGVALREAVSVQRQAGGSVVQMDLDRAVGLFLLDAVNAL